MRAWPLVLLLLVTGVPAGVGAEAAPDRLLLDGREVFLFGVNYPWFNGYRGTDIGDLRPGKEVLPYRDPPSALGRVLVPGVPEGGSGFDADAIERQFREMRVVGVRIVRWFWGYNGRSFYAFDAAGRCTGLTPGTLERLDRIVEIAEATGVALLPSLLDMRFVKGDPGHALKDAHYADGTKEGPHAGILEDPVLRSALIQRGIVPVVERFRDRPGIFGWEIMNEPATVTWGTDPATGFTAPGGHLPEGRRVHVTTMQAFLREAIEAIRAVDERHPVTPAGEARPWFLPLWVGSVDADFYMAHYDVPVGWDAEPAETVAEIQERYLAPYGLVLNRPLVMSECGASFTKGLDRYVDAAWRGGWAGVLAWSWPQLLGFTQFSAYDPPVRPQDLHPPELDFFRRWQRTRALDTELLRAEDCRRDRDGDGVADCSDNCPDDFNARQRDPDLDGRGNRCDPCDEDPEDDLDGDGICGGIDVCPAHFDPDQRDRDGDGVGDACDLCVSVPDPGQGDCDGDGIGDVCDPLAEGRERCADWIDNDCDGRIDEWDPECHGTGVALMRLSPSTARGDQRVVYELEGERLLPTMTVLARRPGSTRVFAFPFPRMGGTVDAEGRRATVEKKAGAEGTFEIRVKTPEGVSGPVFLELENPSSSAPAADPAPPVRLRVVRSAGEVRVWWRAAEDARLRVVRGRSPTPPWETLDHRIGSGELPLSDEAGRGALDYYRIFEEDG